MGDKIVVMIMTVMGMVKSCSFNLLVLLCLIRKRKQKLIISFMSIQLTS